MAENENQDNVEIEPNSDAELEGVAGGTIAPIDQDGSSNGCCTCSGVRRRWDCHCRRTARCSLTVGRARHERWLRGGQPADQGLLLGASPCYSSY